jgi:tetratricopeptide (TPR) repeat protein
MTPGLQPNDSVVELLRIAKEDLARGSLTSAERTLEQAILLNNQVPDAFHYLGHVYSKRGKFKKAILAFQKALALDPFHTEAAIALSSLYNDVGKYKEGAQVFYKAKKRLDKTQPGHDPRINRELAVKHGELGGMYLQYERFIEAHHEFAKALNLDPETPRYAISMARCLSRTGDKEGAVALLKKTLESDSKNVEAKVQLGVLYHSLQKLGEAKGQWQSALDLDPNHKSALMYLSMLEDHAEHGANPV